MSQIMNWSKINAEFSSEWKTRWEWMSVNEWMINEWVVNEQQAQLMKSETMKLKECGRQERLNREL